MAAFWRVRGVTPKLLDDKGRAAAIVLLEEAVADDITAVAAPTARDRSFIAMV